MDALKRAMEIASRDPATTQQLKSKLEDEPWVKVAEFAAYHCQNAALQLAPWQSPPCHDDGPESSALLDEMLEAGISQFEPDPAGALAKGQEAAPMSITPQSGQGASAAKGGQEITCPPGTAARRVSAPTASASERVRQFSASGWPIG